MRARTAVIVVGGIGKDPIVAAAIYCRHSQQCRHWRRQLNLTTAAVNNDRYCRRQRLPSLLPHSWWRWPPEASGHCLLSTMAMVVILDGSSGLLVALTVAAN
jgi:hypothetical protein